MLESKFLREFDDELEKRFPGCVILKNDPGYIQGIPDKGVLFENKWVMLEGKRSRTAPPRPNQPYYVDLLNRMSYASFLYPENAEEVLHEIEQTFRGR